MKPWLAVALALTTNCIVTTQGKTFRGHLDTSQSFHFVGRFGFDVSQQKSYVGHVRYRLTYPKKYAHTLRLLLFYNGTAESPWDKIYNDQTSCSERRAAAESRSNSFLVATPQESFRRPDDMSIKEKEELISYVAILPFKTSKPRYFYIALTNCPTTCKTQACDSPLSKVRYIFQGGNFHGDRDLLSEFSYGDRWFLPLYMMTFILSTFMSAYAVYVSYSLSAANKFHVTVWLLVGSVICFWLGALFKMIHNVIYAIGGIGATSAPLGDDMNDMVETNANLRAGLWEYGIPFEQGWLDKRLPGVGVWQLNVAGDFLNMFADYLMLFKLILVSKGLTINRRRLSSKSLFRVPVYMMFYLLAYVTYLIVNEVNYNEAVYTSKYGTPMGIFLVVLRVVIGAFFFRSVCYTMYKFGSKNGFYRKFVLFGFAWIMVFPLALLICGIMISLGVSSSANMHIDGVLTLFIILPSLTIQIGMLLMYDPNCSRFNKKFPFHAKVTEMKKIKNARIKIVGGDKDEEEGDLTVPRYINLSEKQISALHMKIDTATFRLERVNEAVGYLQTEIDDLEAIGSLDAMLSPPLETARVNCFGDDTRLDDVPDAEEYRAPKPKKNKTARRRRKRRGDRDEDDDGRDRDDGSDNDDSNVNDNNNNDGENGDNANSGGRRQRRRGRKRGGDRSDSDE